MALEKNMTITEEELAANKAATFVRRIAGRFANTKWPALLVLKDKHDDEYYYIENVDALWRAALKIVEARLVQRYYYEPTPPKLAEEVPDAIVEQLPAQLKRKALEDKQANKRATKEYAQDLEQWEEIKTALRDANGALAYKVMDDRRDHEYEGFRLERLKTP